MCRRELELHFNRGHSNSKMFSCTKFDLEGNEITFQFYRWEMK